MIITPRGLYTQPHTSFAGSVMVFAPAAFSILNAQYFVPASLHFCRFKGYCGGAVNSEEANCHRLILQWASTSVVDWQAPLPTEVSMSWSLDWISFSLIWRKAFAGEIKLKIFWDILDDVGGTRRPSKMSWWEMGKEKIGIYKREVAHWPWKQAVRWWCYKWRQADSHQKLEEGRNQSPHRPFVGAQPCWCLNFGLLASSIERKPIHIAFIQKVCGILFHQPQEINTQHLLYWYS